MENQFKLPTKEELRKVPCNETIESVIVDVKITNWLEVLGSDKLLEEQGKNNFENADNQIVIIVKTDSNGFFREEKLFLTKGENPTNRSRYGRFVSRYNEVPTIGMKVSVDFDGDGKSTILLSK